MKNYLKEPLTKEEKSFVYGVIRKSSLKFIREVKDARNSISMTSKKLAEKSHRTEKENKGRGIIDKYWWWKNVKINKKVLILIRYNLDDLNEWNTMVNALVFFYL